MTEFRDFVYIRTDPDPIGAEPTAPRTRKASDLATTRAHLSAVRRDGFNVHRRDAVTERISTAVAASGRPKFNQLLRRLGPQTGLVVLKLDGLGRDAADILKTIQKVRARGAEVYCTAIYVDNMSDHPVALATLEALAKLDRSTAKMRDAANSMGRGVAGGHVGRPPSLDAATQVSVRAGLEAGETVSALARRYSTSRQTILRVRDAKCEGNTLSQTVDTGEKLHRT